MTLLPPNTRVHLAVGYTDMRKGIDGLSMLVQEALGQDPFSGHLFVFHGRAANLLKIIYWDGTGSATLSSRASGLVLSPIPVIGAGAVLIALA